MALTMEAGGARSNDGGNFRSDMSDFGLKNAAEMEAHIAMNASAARANFDKYYAERLEDVSRLYVQVKRRLDVKEPLEAPTLAIDVGVPKFDFTKLQDMFDEKEAERQKAKDDRKADKEAGYQASELFVAVNSNFNQDDPLKLKLTGVDYTNIDKVVKALKDSKNIKRLELSNCGMDHDDCESLGMLIQGNQSITELDLSGNKQIATEGLEKLVEPLSKNDRLINLEMGDCGFGKSAAKHLSKIFSSADIKLQRVQLAANNLGIYGAEALVPGIRANKTIKTLGLQYCGVGNDGINFLKKAFEEEEAEEGGGSKEEVQQQPPNKTLIQVSLENNKADDEQVQVIGKFCWKNSQLDELKHLEGIETDERQAREEETNRELDFLKAYFAKAKEEAQQKEDERKKKEDQEKAKKPENKALAKAPAPAAGKKDPASPSRSVAGGGIAAAKALSGKTPAKSPPSKSPTKAAPAKATPAKAPAGKTASKSPAKSSAKAPAGSSAVKAAAPKKSASPKKAPAKK